MKRARWTARVRLSVSDRLALAFFGFVVLGMFPVGAAVRER